LSCQPPPLLLAKIDLKSPEKRKQAGQTRDSAAPGCANMAIISGAPGRRLCQETGLYQTYFG
jgi:hypothetical protein